MTPAETATLATKIFMEDLRLRGGFRELIASIGDWPDIERAMRDKVQAAVELAMTPKVKQPELDLDS